MDIDEPGWPIIDDFFTAVGEGRRPATVRRYSRVRHRLYDFLDRGDMTLGLGTEPAALLEAERQFHDSGAFWSLWGADELVCCLPSFLHPTWLPEGVVEARLQITLSGRLLTWLSAADLDWQVTSCAFYEAQAAVKQALNDLKGRSSGASEQRMPDRFRQAPGPQW
jgi:hypothetical protein